MITYSAWYDVHIGSPISLFKTFDDFLKVLNPDDPYEILGGDIIDLANCHKSDVDTMIGYRAELKRRYGPRYFDGNHEVTDSDWNSEYISNGIIFRHFDGESWGYERANQYRSKKAGASSFKRNFIIPLIQEYELNNPFRTPKDAVIERAVQIAKDKKCHTYVGGHFHPNSIIDIRGSARVMIMPRGKTSFIS